MKALYKTFALLLASFVLASCGGGGGGSNSAFSPVSFTVTVTPAASSISTNSFTTVLVKVSQQTGGPAVDGAGVDLTLSPATIGTVSGSPGDSGTIAHGVLSGGQASFTFNSSNQTGTAHLVASVTIVLTGDIKGTFTNSGSADVTVTGGNTQDPRLQLTAQTTALPESPFTIADEQNPQLNFPGNYLGSPYISEVTVTWRHTNGQLVSGTQSVNVSVAPTNILTFSTLTSPGSKTDQFHTLLGSGPVDVTGGVGTIYVHAGQVPGTGTLSVTAIDPDSGQTITSQLAISVAAGLSGMPSSISAGSQSDVYVSGSGGPQSTVVSALVTDGGNGFVNAPSGVDNVQFSITGPAGSDARLVATNAAGQQVTGTSVSTFSKNGVAEVTFQAGSQLGPVQVKATADRADNNVDNGITDPVSATATVAVSDGKLFSIKITNPAVNANLLPVITSASSSGSTTPTPVYTVPVTVLGTDRQGKPVLAGTTVHFGLIDAPVFGYPDAGSGTFELSGSDGNPQEGGTLFTAPTGAFTTAGAGAGPGDALIVFGKETTGDADLESARTVQTINNAGSLNVTQAFNLNDTTGVSVDTGPNIPYVIGRATAGNIDASAVTGVDSTGLPNGVASVNMRYPQSRIGQSAVVWAQGTGITQSNGVAKTVADAVRTRYLGIGPAKLTASPATIFGNTTQTVTACLDDAAGSPIPGITINFSFTGLNGGTGTADGKSGGALAHPTGADGCVTTTVVTSGIQPGSSAQLVFTVNDLSATVTISVGSAVLTAQPNSIVSQSGTTPENDNVLLTLKDGLGNPVANATITGACTSSAHGTITLVPPSVVTDASGTANVTVTTQGFCVASGAPGSSTCTFTYSQGSVTAKANVSVTGAVLGGVSPQPTCR